MGWYWFCRRQVAAGLSVSLRPRISLHLANRVRAPDTNWPPLQCRLSVVWFPWVPLRGPFSATFSAAYGVLGAVHGAAHSAAHAATAAPSLPRQGCPWGAISVGTNRVASAATTARANFNASLRLTNGRLLLRNASAIAIRFSTSALLRRALNLLEWATGSGSLVMCVGCAPATGTA